MNKSQLWCIRLGFREEECAGHQCVSCGKTFFCHQDKKHECSPRPERTQTGIVRTPTETERMLDGFKLLAKIGDD